jgi:hypothetical protein
MHMLQTLPIGVQSCVVLMHMLIVACACLLNCISHSILTVALLTCSHEVVCHVQGEET